MHWSYLWMCIGSDQLSIPPVGAQHLTIPTVAVLWHGTALLSMLKRSAVNVKCHIAIEAPYHQEASSTVPSDSTRSDASAPLRACSTRSWATSRAHVSSSRRQQSEKAGGTAGSGPSGGTWGGFEMETAISSRSAVLFESLSALSSATCVCSVP